MSGYVTVPAHIIFRTECFQLLTTLMDFLIILVFALLLKDRPRPCGSEQNQVMFGSSTKVCSNNIVRQMAWPNARVSALLPDSDGGVWVGTLGDGLLHLKDGKFTRITSLQGLPDNSITELLEDEDGNLWGGTYKGIFRASKQDLKYLAADETNEITLSVFGHFDGLPAQAYSGWFQPSCWRSHDGRLWFTTVKGLVVVNPRDVVVNHRPPPVVIEEMRMDGESYDFASAVNDRQNFFCVLLRDDIILNSVSLASISRNRTKCVSNGGLKAWKKIGAKAPASAWSAMGRCCQATTAFVCLRRIAMASGTKPARAWLLSCCLFFGKRGGSKHF